MGKKVGKKYFDREYWEDGTKSGYSLYTYDKQGYLMEAEADLLIELYGDKGKWLDIGCAFGLVVEQLILRDVNAYGVDISKYAIKNSPVPDRVKCSDCLNPKLYDPEEFDIIYSIEVAEHVFIDDVPKWISNIHRWLKKDGALLLTICTGLNNYRGLDDNDESHQTLQPREWWNDQFLNAGFIWDELAYVKATTTLTYTPRMKFAKPMVIMGDKHVFTYRKN